MDFKEPIPSPFMPELSVMNKFIKDVEEVAKKYGYSQVYIAVGKPASGDTSDWFAQSNALSEGMVMCLKDSVVNMEREIDKLKKDDET